MLVIENDRYLDICAFKPLGNIAFVVSCLEIYVVNFLSHSLPTHLVINMKPPEIYSYFYQECLIIPQPFMVATL